jgi:hypothetical protein
VQPKSPLQFGLAAGLLAVVLAWVLPKVESACGARQASASSGWIMAVLGPVLLVVAAAALRVYALPAVQNSTLQLAALIGGIVLVFLLVVVPVSRAVFNSSYSGSLISTGVAFLCGAVAVLAVHLGFRAVSLGEHTAGKIEEHKEEIKQQ